MNNLKITKSKIGEVGQVLEESTPPSMINLGDLKQSTDFYDKIVVLALEVNTVLI